MDELRELARIVSRQKVKALATKPWSLDGHPAEAALYKMLAENPTLSEAEAWAALKKQKKGQGSIQSVKTNLWGLLEAALWQIDLNQPGYNSRQRAYFACYKQWGAFKLLLGKNTWAAVLHLGEKLLKNALRFELTDIVVDVLRTLRLYYGSIAGDLKKYAHYQAQATYWEEALHFENLAEALYTDLVVRFVNSKAASAEVHEQARAAYTRLADALNRFDTYRLHLSGRLLEVLIHSSINNYAATTEVCDRAVRFFEAKPYPANIPLQIFLYQEMVCYVQLRDYPHGQAAAERGLRLLEKGAFNWFKYQELLVTLSLHTRQYQRAYEIFTAATAHRRFGALPASIREVWRIIEAYIYYLISLGKISAPAGDATFSRFRMARFVNETPIFARDKRGMNIPILIFQVLSLIHQRRYDDAIDRIEAVAKYCARYLRRDDTFRSNCFIKMLLVIPAQSFHRAAVLRHAQKYVEMLHKNPLDLANQAHDIELIPYEDLWEMAVASLDTTRRQG